MRSILGQHWVPSLKKHEPYTEPKWHGDEVRRLAGHRPACPDCGSDQDFGPRHHSRPDGSERHYRACKACGFWHEADGLARLPRLACAHDCAQPVGPAQLVATCASCGQRLTAGAHSEPILHVCAKYLTPWEPGFTCTNCRAFVDRSFLRPHPLPGRIGQQPNPRMRLAGVARPELRPVPSATGGQRT